MSIKNAWQVLWDRNESNNLSDLEADSKPKGKIEVDANALNSGYVSDGQTSNQQLNDYKRYGFMKNIVNALADDATREWFKIKITKIGEDDDFNSDVAEQIAQAMLERAKDFNLQEKIRNLIKFSRIYDEGSLLYFGIDGGRAGTAETLNKSIPIPASINKVDFINLVDDPDLFDTIIYNISDPTVNTYNVPMFQISGMEIHPSRVAYLVNEYDSQSETGISLVDIVRDGVLAQSAGLSGSTHILERLGAIKYKSSQNSLDENNRTTIAEVLLFMREKLKSNGAIAVLPEDEVELLQYTFSGTKDVFDYVIENLTGLSGVPRMRIMGHRGGGIITGDGSEAELLNWFSEVSGYQENRLAPILRKTFDLFLRETGTQLGRLVNGKTIDYDFEFCSLYEMTDKARAESREINAKADKIDFETGKATGEELRSLDPRYKDLKLMAEYEDEESNTPPKDDNTKKDANDDEKQEEKPGNSGAGQSGE